MSTMYRATFEYNDPDRTGMACTTIIIFMADNIHDAFMSASRWWTSRHTQWPQVFGKALAIDIDYIIPQTVDLNGELKPFVARACEAWKCDIGYTLEQWALKQQKRIGQFEVDRAAREATR